MCNKLHISIASVSRCGQFHGFVPCGKCFDCRESMKASWVFRLRVELSQLCEKGWKIGFFTLTYSDEHLPYIPEELFKSAYRPIPCFDKTHVRTFFIKLKKWLLKKYGCRKDTACKYMLCSEFGEHTQRPHYHGIICFPPNVDAELLHRKIKQLWYHSEKPDELDQVPNVHGFVIPFNFNGERDFRGEHKPFLCTSVKAAALYAAKYVCKDLAWHESVKHDEFSSVGFVEDCFVNQDEKDYSNPIVFVLNYKKVYKLKDYQPFHFQSKSLGLSFLDGLSDSEKLTYLKDGFSFLGDDTFQMLPVYLRNKILFDPVSRFVAKDFGNVNDRRKADWSWSDEKGKFVYTPCRGTHVRLVRRKVKKFFEDNLSEIFEVKRKSVEDKLRTFLSSDFWNSTKAPKCIIDEVNSLSIRSIDLKQLSADYLAYFGVPYEECYSFARSVQWYRRYDESAVDVRGCNLISVVYYQRLHYDIARLFLLGSSYERIICADKLKKQRELSRVHDFHKSGFIWKICL